jgi:hypothetical protein
VRQLPAVGDPLGAIGIEPDVDADLDAVFDIIQRPARPSWSNSSSIAW